MMGFGGAELLIIGLLNVGIGLPLGVPPAEQDPLMLRVAPENCLYYTTWAGMATPKADTGNATESLLAEPEVQRFVQEIDKAITAGLPRVLSDVRDPDAEFVAEMGPIWAKTLLTNSTAIYLSELELQPDGPPKIQAAAIVNSGEATIKVRDSLLKLQARHLGDDVKEVDIDGVKFYELQMAPKAPPITWGVRGKYILLGVGEDAVQSLFANARTGPPAWLTDLQKQLPVNRTSTITYADLGGLIQRGLAGLNEEDAAQARNVVDALGLSNVESYTAVSGLDKEAFITRTLVSIKGESKGIFALADAEPLTAGDFAPIPRDAAVAFTLRLNTRKVLDTVQQIARDADPETSAQIESGLDALAKWLGMDLREDILSGLGDAWCVYLSPGEGGLSFMGLTATVDVRDKEKVEKAYTKLMALAQASWRGQDVEVSRYGGPMRPHLKAMEFEGRTIYYIMGLQTDVDQLPFVPAWCLTDTHLVVSVLPQNITAMLGRDADFQSLATAPEVAAPLAAKPGPLSITYFDTKALFEVLYPMAQMLATAGLNELAQREGIEIDPTILPRADVISRHLRPSVTAVARTERGLEFTSRQTLPGSSAGSTTPVAVALLLPAVNAAREAARRNGSLNNIRQLGLAIANHESATRRYPAQAIPTADGKPGLSWRVKILPFIEEKALYDEFHLDEPWDSEHNKKLITRMPVTLRSPKSSAPLGMTTYLAVIGEDSAIAKGTEGNRIRDLSDGISKTAILVEANDDHAVIWTKPDDHEYDDMDPADGLGGVWTDRVFYICFADVHARSVSEDIAPKTLNAIFTKSGGEAVDWDNLDEPAADIGAEDFDAVPDEEGFEEEALESVP